MKKLLFVVITALVITACSKDPNDETAEMLDGTWEATSITIDGEEAMGDSNLIQSQTTTYTVDEDASGSFTADAETAFGPGTGSGTFTITNEGESIEMTDEDGTSTFSITFDGDSYTMKGTINGQEQVEKSTKQD